MIQTGRKIRDFIVEMVGGVYSGVTQWLSGCNWGHVSWLIDWCWRSVQDGAVWLKDLAWAGWKSLTGWICYNNNAVGEILTSICGFVFKSKCK